MNKQSVETEELLEKKIMHDVTRYDRIDKKIQEQRQESLRLLKGVIHKYDH